MCMSCSHPKPAEAHMPAFSSAAHHAAPAAHPAMKKAMKAKAMKAKRKKKVAEKEEGLLTDETTVKKAKKKKKGIKKAKKKKKAIKKEEGHQEGEEKEEGHQNFTDEDLETWRLCGSAFFEIADLGDCGDAWRRDVENFVVKVVQELSSLMSHDEVTSLMSHEYSQAHHRRALRRALAEEFLRLRPIMTEIVDIV